MPIIVLDVGDVLVRLDRQARDRAVIHYQLRSNLELVSYRDISRQVQIDFGLGKRTEEDYLAELSKSFNVPTALIEQAELSMITDANRVLVDFLYELRMHFEIACLSNNQPIHWRKIRTMLPADLFSKAFLSHEVGLRKPDANIYDLAASQLDAPKDELIFIDDEVENVSAALSAGWRAFRHTENQLTIEWLRSELSR